MKYRIKHIKYNTGKEIWIPQQKILGVWCGDRYGSSEELAQSEIDRWINERSGTTTCEYIEYPKNSTEEYERQNSNTQR